MGGDFSHTKRASTIYGIRMNVLWLDDVYLITPSQIGCTINLRTASDSCQALWSKNSPYSLGGCVVKQAGSPSVTGCYSTTGNSAHFPSMFEMNIDYKTTRSLAGRNC